MIITVTAGSQPRPVGGVTTRYEYANGLARLGHEVHLIHASWFRSSVTSLDEIGWFEFDPGLAHHFVREGEPFEFPLADVISEPSLGLPHEYGLPFRWAQGTLLVGGAAQQAIFATPCLTVCIARWIYDELVDAGYPERLVEHVPNGIDHDRFHLVTPIDDRPRQVSMLYGSTPVKGARDGLAALEVVHERVPDARVVVFGASRPADPLPSWVTFVEDAPQQVIAEEVYNRSQVFLCSSRWGEGFGKTGLEAMACGAAVVTTDNGGSREYAHHGDTALVAPPQDVEALGDHVVRLLTDHDARVAMATRGHELSQRFSWEASARRLEAVLATYVADPARYFPPP